MMKDHASVTDPVYILSDFLLHVESANLSYDMLCDVGKRQRLTNSTSLVLPQS